MGWERAGCDGWGRCGMKAEWDGVEGDAAGRVGWGRKGRGRSGVGRNGVGERVAFYGRWDEPVLQGFDHPVHVMLVVKLCREQHIRRSQGRVDGRYAK